MAMSAAGYEARREAAAALSLAELAEHGRPVALGELGRRCAVPGCHRLLARMNRDTLCFRCQAAERGAVLRGQMRPVSDVEARREDPWGDRRTRPETKRQQWRREAYLRERGLA